MKKTFLFIGLILTGDLSFAQKHAIDSMLHVLSTEKEDTNRVNTLNSLASALYSAKPDTAVLLTNRAIALANKLGWEKGKALSYNNAGLQYKKGGDYRKALDYFRQSLKISEEIGNKNLQASNLSNIGSVFFTRAIIPNR